MDMYSLLKIAFDGGFNGMNPKEIQKLINFTGVKVRTFEEGCQFIEIGANMDRVYLTIKGECNVVKYSTDGKTIIIDVLSPVQLFGMFELLTDICIYQATVTAVDKTIAIEFPADIISKYMDEDIAVCKLVAKYLAELMSNSATRNERTLLNTSIQNLVLYIHKYCRNKPFPVVVLEEREHMSVQLNINLRTLYRYLDKLKIQELITIENRKITISCEQFLRIDQISREING